MRCHFFVFLCLVALTACGQDDNGGFTKEPPTLALGVSLAATAIDTATGEVTGCNSGLSYPFSISAGTPRPLPAVTGDTGCVVVLTSLSWGGFLYEQAGDFDPAPGARNRFTTASGNILYVAVVRQMPDPIAPADPVLMHVGTSEEGEAATVEAPPACTLEVTNLGRVFWRKTRFRVDVEPTWLTQATFMRFYPCGTATAGVGCHTQRRRIRATWRPRNRYWNPGPYQATVVLETPFGDVDGCQLEVTIPR